MLCGETMKKEIPAVEGNAILDYIVYDIGNKTHTGKSITQDIVLKLGSAVIVISGKGSYNDSIYLLLQNYSNPGYHQPVGLYITS